MSDLNYPDNLYADHLASQEPTGAYRASAETDTVEAALRAACIALSNAIDRLRTAQSAYLRERDQPTGCNAPIQPARQTTKQAYDEQTRRDVAWSAKRGDYLPPNLAASVKTPLEPTRIATPAELADLRQLLTAEELKGFGIGDVPKVGDWKMTDDQYAEIWRKPNPHPMAAEALRQADEFGRGDKETGV